MSDPKATMQTRATSKQRSAPAGTGHQRSLSAPKPTTSRRKAPQPNSRPSPNMSPSQSRPVSRSSNDHAGESESASITQPRSDKSKRRTRNGRRNASDSDQKDRSVSDREDSLTPIEPASPTKPSRRSKKARPQSQLAMQLPLPVSQDTVAEESFPTTLLSKSAPTASFLSRKNAKQPSSRTASKPDWDMPVISQRPVQDSLTWQQTLLGGSRAVDDSTVSSKSTQQPSPALVFQKQKPQAAQTKPASGLTWQQIALGENEKRPSTGRSSPTKASRNAPRRGRSRNEGSGSDSSPLPTMSSLSLKPIVLDDVFTSASPQKPMLQKKAQSSPAVTTGAVMVNGELKYAGPDFHNSPRPSDLPAPGRKRVVV